MSLFFTCLSVTHTNDEIIMLRNIYNSENLHKPVVLIIKIMEGYHQERLYD